MTSIANDLLVVALAAVCLYRAVPAAPFSAAIHADYVSAESGKNVRGLLSMAVVFHHLAQVRDGVVLFPMFAKLGYLSVSVFFFFSGFGLMKQYMYRETYSSRFLLRRLPTVLVPYLIATALYWLLYQIVGTPWTLRATLDGFWNGMPIVTASWYILCILLFYIAFWLLMRLCGKHYKRMLCGGAVYCGLYVLFCVKMGYGSWWYNTAPVLIFGMAWALYERKIDSFFRERYWTAAPGVFVLFAAVYGIKIICNRRISGPMVAVPMTWCTAILFACCVILVLMKLKIQNPILRWLGEISLETYLCHYLFMTLFYSKWIRVENDFLYAVLVLVCTLGFAHVFHLANRRILKSYTKFLETYTQRSVLQ